MVTGTSEIPARRTWEKPLSLLFTTLLILVVATVSSDAADSEVREKTSANPQEAGTPTQPRLQGQRWSNPATWGGAVPEEGHTVTIPAGKTVMLDTSPPRLDGLRVNGTLRFEDKQLALRSDWIMVHGKMEVGTPADRFRSRARIVLTGSDETQDVMNMGAKVLGIMGGILEIHGQERKGWTHLAATAAKGAEQLTLLNAAGWRAGDRIVVASTDYDPLQAEERTITAVSANTVTLDEPLDYTHWGSLQTVAGGTINERAEVALLSRNVVIAGEEATSGDGFGGQIMVMEGGQARIDGAELTRMGQKNTLRRYPLHFHMLGAAGDPSYLKNTSIHERRSTAASPSTARTSSM